MIGQTISHYKILEKLGEGGMGVVYKAEDIKLRRSVALKFLPRQVILTDADRSRFVREAEVAASLSHPSIAMIYEFDEIDDPATGGKSAFIAMEFVEGTTLKEKIDGRPLPIQEVIAIAIAVAEGLQEAHEKGIVHRDIKSANVMVTAKGQVKIMDFGLAEIAGRTAVTKAGTRLGTVAYMSPEQALGEKLDRRTDIWSLGVVVYEMATGTHPFPGDYDQAVVYQILNQEPEPITSLRSNVPMELERIVRKAMQKDRDNRYQHVDEMLVDLRALRKEFTSRVSTEASRVYRESRTGVRSLEDLKQVPRSRKARGLWLSMTLLLFLSTLLMTFLYLKREPTSQQTIRATILPPPNYNFTYAAGGQTAISPDGRTLAFVTSDFGIQQLWVHSLDASTAQPLAGTEGAFLPFWSPDSRVIGFFSAEKLKRIEASGGTPQTICDARQPRGATWSKDGLIVFALNTTGLLYKVNAAGGTPVPITVLDTAQHELTQRWPCFLPDGEHFLYFGYTLPGAKRNAIKIGSLTTGFKKSLFPAHTNVAYANGYLVFLQGTTLMAQLFDTKALELRGEPVPIAEDVRFEVGIGRGDFSVSQNGILVCRAGVPQVAEQLLIVDRTGKTIKALGPPTVHSNPRVSPDGQRIALDMFDLTSRNRDIWIYELTRESLTRITTDPAADLFPIWSPDGSKIVYHSDRNGFHDLFMRDLSGAHAEESLLVSGEDKEATDWSSNGTFLIYTAWEAPRRGRDIWILPLTGERKPKVWLKTEFDEWDPRLSPDMRWMAYVSNQSGRYEVYVQEFAGGGSRRQVSMNGGEVPRWGRNGKELLFFGSSEGKVMAAEIGSVGTKLEVGEVRPLIDMKQLDAAFFNDVFPGGEKLVLTTAPLKRTPTPMTLIVNWPNAIERKWRK